MFKALLRFILTAAAEIFGCYVVYAWLKLDRPVWWLAPGALSLALFAWLLTLHPTLGAGRIYAAYGGVYVAASLAWLWLVEGTQPDRWDLIGSALCITGTRVILLGPRWQCRPTVALMNLPSTTKAVGAKVATARCCSRRGRCWCGGWLTRAIRRFSAKHNAHFFTHLPPGCQRGSHAGSGVRAV